MVFRGVLAVAFTSVPLVTSAATTVAATTATGATTAAATTAKASSTTTTVTKTAKGNGSMSSDSTSFGLAGTAVVALLGLRGVQ